MDLSMLQDALRREAIAAFQRATAPRDREEINVNRDIVVAIDKSNHILLEVLAYGAGGKQLYSDLHISRLVSIDTTNSDTQSLRSQVGLKNGTSWPGHMIAFIVPPSLATVQLIAMALAPFTPQLTSQQCAVLWLPAVTPECTLEMERQGIAGIVEQRNLSIGLLPVDRNVASLCQERVFSDLYVHGQHHALTRIVQSLLAIEKTSGLINQITCHGPFALRVKQLLTSAHQLQPRRSSSSSSVAQFERLIVIDRMEDPLSMLLTPMNYEGLLDALIGMNHGVVSFDKPATNDQSDLAETQATERVKILVNHLDELFDDIRDVNINKLIGHRLAEIAQSLVTEARGGAADTGTSTPSTLPQITALLKKVPHLVKKKRSLANHLILVEQIQQRSQQLGLRTCVETEMAILSSSLKRGLNLPLSSTTKDIDRVLEEAILRQDPLVLDAYDVLKLLCLQSLVAGGLKDERLAWYRQQLCHSYGYHLLPLFVQLEKLELLSSKNKFDYQRRRRELSLVNDIISDEDSGGGQASTTANRDIHFMFPYTGYAPMSVRLVQTSLGMKVKTGLLSNTKSSSSSLATRTASAKSMSDGDASSLFGGGSDSITRRRHILVYYIGGVTVAELAAFRWLNANQDEYEIFVATTAICNGTRLLRSIN